MSDGLDSLTAANDVAQPPRLTMKIQLLPLNRFSLQLLLHWLMLVTSILRRLQSNQIWGLIGHSFLISPHSTYNIQIILIPILYILCRYITITPVLYHNPLLVYPPIVSTLILIIKYHRARKYNSLVHT